jgi:hypothetical protein
LSVADLSGFQKENSRDISVIANDFAMYADEFGVLRYLKTNPERYQTKHSPIVKNSEVSVTNYVLNQEAGNLNNNYTSRIDEFESARFGHSYYVSRFFVILPSTASSYSGIGTSLRVNDPDQYNIRVIDSSGNKYVNSMNQNNYEIFIEKYQDDINETSYNYYRIIVVLDEPDPIGLYLVYDKYEKNKDGIPFNQFLNYKEYINAVPSYKYTVEESEVIDQSSFNKRIYSTQLFSHKENKLLKNKTEDEGWKVITPKKAIQDPRTFQNFNWRLLAKINYDFSKIKDIYEDSERARLNAAVLYSGSLNSIQNPYVFANLEESVINQQNLIFVNPLAATTDKTKKAYWALNIDTFATDYFSNPDAYNYDFLVWTPNATITEHQKRAVDNFLSKGVSIFIDCSNLDQASLTASGLNNFDFNLTSTQKNTGLIKIVDEYVTGEETLNGWDLDAYHESTDAKKFGIFGPRWDVFNNNAIRPIRVFSGTPESQDGSAKSIAYIQDGSNNYTAILKDKYNINSEFSAFAVYCLNPFLTYINDNYGGSGIGISAPNRGESNTYPVGRVGDQIALLSEAVIGPNRMFYNILSESNKNKVNSKLQFSRDSTIVWNISPWRNAWTINGKRDSSGKINVLFEDEKKVFKFSEKVEEVSDSITTQVLTTYFCRELNPSIGSLLVSDFELTSMPIEAQSLINSDYSNIEFYIECTNDNVGFLNFQKIDNTNYIFSDVKTSYTIHKLNSSAKEKLTDAPLTVDAYSKVLSREFDINSIYYPYVILDYSDYQAQVNSVIKVPSEYLPGSQFVRDYDFAFQTQVFVTKVITNRYSFDVKWKTQFTTDLNVNVTGGINIVTEKGTAEVEEGKGFAIDVQKSDPERRVIGNQNSPFGVLGYAYPTNVYSQTDITAVKPKARVATLNSFHYTGDIPLTQYGDEYFQGKSGPLSGGKLVEKVVVDTTAQKPTVSTSVVTGNAITRMVDYAAWSSATSSLYSGGAQVKNQGYYYEVRPPQSEYETIKQQIVSGFGALYSTLVANWDKLYWFAPVNANPNDKGIVVSLEEKFVSFEKQRLNEISRLPYNSEKTKTTDQLAAIHEVYQSDSTSITVNGKTINIASTFNLAAGTTGKQFYTSVITRFANEWAVFNPRYSITEYANGGTITQQQADVVPANTPAPATQTELVQTGGSNTYMKYIQFTLQQMNYSLKINGVFDSATHNAVVNFQKQKKLNPNRNYGVVDSETKSVLATYWLNLAKNNTPKFEELRKKAFQYQIVRFIDAAIQYSDISNICNPSSSNDYRRISYTGIDGPTAIEDWIFVEVPQVQDSVTGQIMPWQELNSIKIQAGAWPVTVVDVSLYTTDLAASTFTTPAAASGDMFFQFGSGQVIGANKSIEIPLNAKRAVKYVKVHVVGGKINLPGTSVAEGFSISDIRFNVTTPTLGKGATQDRSGTFGVNANAVGRGTIWGTTTVQSGDFGVFKLGTIADAIGYPNSTIDSVILGYIDIDVLAIDEDGNPKLDLDGNLVTNNYRHFPDNETLYSSGNWNSLDGIDFSVDELNFSVESISGSTVMGGAAPFIYGVNKKSPTGVTALNSTEISQQFEILNNRAPIYQVVTTNGVEIDSDEFSEITDVNSFYLADADTNAISSKQNIKKSVNAKDGAVILLNANNTPAGFPDYSKFDQPNVDISFGATMLQWNLKDSNGNLVPPPEGLQWGFYNIRTKEFLGKKLSYQYLASNKRDVFIGVLAFDADGDSKTTENILGIDNRVGTLAQFQFPAKSICPVYSVRVSDRAKIAVSNPPSYLSKFDTWFVNVSRGRFYKQIEIPTSYNFLDWRKNYKGKLLRSFYDTTRIPIPSSGLFGSGYYDIFEENPIVVSQNEIQLRHGSVHVAQEQIDKLNSLGQYTDASPIEPWIQVYVQDSDSSWKMISSNQIRNFNKHNGTITFANEIVPSEEKKIKVSYTLKNPNIMLYHVDGKEIPLNPYVNFTQRYYDNQELQESASDVGLGAPIYFYILPSEVEELVNGEYAQVSDYFLVGSPVKFTTDYSIFTQTSMNYNPFAIHIGTAMVNNKYNLDNVDMLDLRVKGGGISASSDLRNVLEENSNVLSFSDIHSGKGYLYPNGGYVIVKIPKEVKDNFGSIDQVYAIVRANLTAGVAFDIQDMDGNDWRTI